MWHCNTALARLSSEDWHGWLRPLHAPHPPYHLVAGRTTLQLAVLDKKMKKTQQEKDKRRKGLTWMITVTALSTTSLSPEYTAEQWAVLSVLYSPECDIFQRKPLKTTLRWSTRYVNTLHHSGWGICSVFQACSLHKTQLWLTPYLSSGKSSLIRISVLQCSCYLSTK